MLWWKHYSFPSQIYFCFQVFGSAKSYLDVNELIEREVLDMLKERKVEEDEKENKGGKRKSLKEQFSSFRKQINELDREWLKYKVFLLLFGWGQ